MKGKSVRRGDARRCGPGLRRRRATLHELEHALADPGARGRAGRAGRALRRGAGALRVDSAATALEARAREVLAGLGFAPAQMDGDVGALSGGWKMRVGARAHPGDAARRAAARRAHQPPRPRVDPVARGLARAHFEGALRDDLARPRVPEPHGRRRSSRSTAASSSPTRATTISTSASARSPSASRRRSTRASRRCSRRRRPSSRASRRARATRRRCSRASKKLEKIEKVEPPKRRQTLEFEFRPRAALGRRRRARSPACTRPTASASSSTGSICWIRRRERWCVMGANGAGKSTLLKLVAGEAAPDAGSVDARRRREARLLRAALDGAARRRRHASGRRSQDAFPSASIGSLRALAGCFGFSGDDDREALPAALGRREGAPRAGAHALRPAELPGARRAHQPPRSGDQGDADPRARRLRGHAAARLARSALPRGAHEPRARARRRRRRASTPAATPSTSPRAATKRRACAARSARQASGGLAAADVLAAGARCSCRRATLPRA